MSEVQIGPGTYVGTVIDHFMKQSKNTGNWAVLVRFNVEGLMLPAHVWLTEKAMNMARKSLKAIGFDPDTQELSELEHNSKLLEGNTAEVVVDEQEYNNELQLKISFINPLREKPGDDQLKKLTMGLRAAKSKNGKSSPVSKSKSSSKVQPLKVSSPPTEDDDVGF